ncbi:transcriptional regulator [Amycolatopsis rhabdoformis]|uniref:Transcriptional regulator n=1 Tax=Amycolatopsis rhabdoformis TaxID=1448059 RepID=A0ABZ1IFN5_9PSEU|nr:transcriptional regulator [Amycolatopsis rhabdoformis]WSE32275.1 transcriptional regulator [Amycolatopsis rhabdoformis]
MNSADQWTGRTASALQAALRLSNERFAERLGIAARTVAGWHQKPDLRPKSEMQQVLDIALEQATPAERARFAEHLGDPAAEPSPADERLDADPHIGAALEWLDKHAGWSPGSARQAVAERLATLDVRELHDRGTRRGWVSQRNVAAALTAYYGSRLDDHGLFTARCGDLVMNTSVLTCTDWLDLDCELRPPYDRFRVPTAQPEPDLALDDHAARRAVQRLAETLAMNTRLSDNPIYRLLSTDIRERQLDGTFGGSRFVHYALTVDLLEGELVDAVAADSTAMPLRDRYLPDLGAVLDVSSRLTAGGVLALTAIARPADPYRGDADYLLLVQERSGNVLNAARRLAVIPKGFHQPLTDVRRDAQVGITLRRELEEELFGRPDIDNTVAEQLAADPLHPSRLTEPMHWLMAEPDRLRMECTGFGLNLVSGNYEFASLIVIDDEEFWERYGGVVEANWESATLRQYSTTDTELVTELLGDVAWSNEGLFAMAQGLRRLAQIGGERVKLPAIEWEISQ